MVQQVRGFTLVELLIVIAIIGVLSSTVLVALNDTRAKANNARRMADLKELQKHLSSIILTTAAIRCRQAGAVLRQAATAPELIRALPSQA